MKDMTWFTMLSTVGALLAMAIGVMLPARAMGEAISKALESLAIYVLVVVLIVLFRNPLLEYLLK
jgi:F-type H+-transporting ATPase subunit c